VEAARETDWQFPSLTAAVFKDELPWDLLHPFPAQDGNDARISDAGHTGCKSSHVRL
jgi:hypothetical protein